MAYQRPSKGNLALRYYQKKAGIPSEQICKVLNITLKSYKYWLEHPFAIKLGYLYTLAGLFGIPVSELVHCITQNKPQANDLDKWYLLEQYEKGDKVLSKLNDGK